MGHCIIQAFARAVEKKYDNHLRLSIHPSTNEMKISISLLPTTTLYTTPWHCVVAYRADGTIVSGMRQDFDTNSEFELVYKNGNPCYYREKLDLFHWATDEGGINCDPLYPSDWIIPPAAGAFSLSACDIDGQKSGRCLE